MPVYDYKCADHGLFYELASMDDSSKPAACPNCAKLSERVIMVAP
ncbi:zinc ribbon domain-containing protein, partial [Cellvibrio sp.]